MKRALVTENGIVTDIVDTVEEQFEIHGLGDKFNWVEAPDDVNNTSVMVNGVFYSMAQRGAPFSMRRRIGYGSIADQLDMLFKDHLNNTTTWADHIVAVKENVPKPDDLSNDPLDNEIPEQDPTKKPWEV